MLIINKHDKRTQIEMDNESRARKKGCSNAFNSHKRRNFSYHISF